MVVKAEEARSAPWKDDDFRESPGKCLKLT